MARVASCPKCEHELFVPDGAAADAWAKCPECGQHFQLKEAAARELSTIELVDSEAVGDDFLAEPPEKTKAATPWLAEASDVVVPAEVQSPEAAAQRIDQWFRSAKTLSDMPGIEAGASSQLDDGTEAARSATQSAPVDFDEQDSGIAGLDSDFQLEPASELPRESAAWDDSQHMDRLLADVQGQPIDTFERASVGPASGADRETQPGANGSLEIPLSIQLVNKQRRKRSLARTLVLSMLGAVIGLSLGYYALLWIRGPQLDFLDLARYLPKAALPASFHPLVKSAPAAPPSSMIDDVAASKKADLEPSVEKTAAPPASAEQQTAFTTPEEPVKTAIPDDDRYAIAGAKSDDAATEPAPLEAPLAAPLAENPPPAEPVRVAGAPSYTEADVAAALKVAIEAEPVLAKGSWSESAEIAQAKGKSYMALADLARKSTFAQASGAATGATNTEQQADEFFQRVLSDAHVRNEVSQIVPRWLAHPKRPQNGIFLAGHMARGEIKGSVIEYIIELIDGPQLTVLVPGTAAPSSDTSPRQAAVVGLIVDKPAEIVAGYTGNAPQAVFAKKLLPLQ